jgi:hypothetical protein
MWVLNKNITIYLEMNSVLEGGNQIMLQGLLFAIEAPSTNKSFLNQLERFALVDERAYGWVGWPSMITKTCRH